MQEDQEHIITIYQSAADRIQALRRQQRTLIEQAVRRKEQGALSRLRKKLGL